MKTRNKIIAGFVLFSFVCIGFGYLYINQTYLINKYKFKKTQQHSYSEETLMVVSSGDILSLKPDQVDIETKSRIYGNIYE